MGGVRAQFATPVNIRMSMYSIPFFAAFEETWATLGYRPQGYLCRLSRHMDYLRQNYHAQIEAGLKDVRLLDRAGVSLSPGAALRRHHRRQLRATDGFVDPHSVMTGFMGVERGVQLMRDTEVTDSNRRRPYIRRRNPRISRHTHSG